MTMLLSLLPTMLWADSEWNNTINKQSEKDEYTLSLNGSAVQSTEGYFTFGTPYSENPSRYNKFSNVSLGEYKWINIVKTIEVYLLYNKIIIIFA